jgi:polysaccharide pyruvyl transferase WcaK-like protein
MDTSYFAYERSTTDSRDDGLPHPHKTQTAGKLPASQPYIIININKNGEHFLNNIAQDIQTYLDKGYAIYFVPVAKGHNNYYNDLNYAKLLEKKLTSNDAFHVLDRESDFSYFIQILKKAEKVISTRLHLFLIASFLGVPTKVYPYQRKILKMQKVIEKFAKKE